MSNRYRAVQHLQTSPVSRVVTWLQVPTWRYVWSLSRMPHQTRSGVLTERGPRPGSLAGIAVWMSERDAAWARTESGARARQ